MKTEYVETVLQLCIWAMKQKRGRDFGHRSYGTDCLMSMLPGANPHNNIQVMPTVLFPEHLFLGVLSREYPVTLKYNYYFKAFLVQST